MIGWMPEKISHQLFAAAGYDSSLLVKANQPGFKASASRVTTEYHYESKSKLQ
jgi:hypothetical protein